MLPILILQMSYTGAIRAHGGEAQNLKDAFFNLSKIIFLYIS